MSGSEHSFFIVIYSISESSDPLRQGQRTTFVWYSILSFCFPETVLPKPRGLKRPLCRKAVVRPLWWSLAVWAPTAVFTIELSDTCVRVGSKFCIVIYSMWLFFRPLCWAQLVDFYCNLQRLGVTLASGMGKQSRIVIYSIWWSINPCVRDGKSLLYCNLQHLGVILPLRQGWKSNLYSNLQHLGVI